MTSDLRSVYRLTEYKLSLPSTAPASLSLGPLLELHVKSWDWFWGSPSEIAFCSDPIDMRFPLTLDRYAKEHRARKTSLEVEGTGTGEVDIFEQFKEGRAGKTVEAIRKDARAVLAILWQEHRPTLDTPSVSSTAAVNPGTQQGTGRERDSVDPGQEDGQDPSPPNINSYEAPPFQLPPNLSLSNLTPPTPTPSPPSPDPIAERLRAGGMDRMELYEMLIKRQVEGKDVDWAFTPAPSMGGEAGLARILDGITGEFGFRIFPSLIGYERHTHDKVSRAVFGLDPDKETEDDSDSEKDIPPVKAKDRRSQRIRGPPIAPPKAAPPVPHPKAAGRMMRMTRVSQPESDEDEDDSDDPQIQEGESLSDDESEGETVVILKPEPLLVPKKERSSSPVWASSPPAPPRVVHKPVVEQESLRRDSPAREEARAMAEEVDGMLVDPSDDEPERAVIEQEAQPVPTDHADAQRRAEPQAAISPTRRLATPPQATATSPIQTTVYTTPSRRPNVKKIPLDTPSSDEGETLPSILGKRKAPTSSPNPPDIEGSERESKRLQRIKMLKLLEEQVEKMKTSIEIETDAPEELAAVTAKPSQVPGSSQNQPLGTMTTMPVASPSEKRLPVSGVDRVADKSTTHRQVATDRTVQAQPSHEGQYVPQLQANKPRRFEGLTVGDVIAIREQFRQFRAFLQRGSP